jgi:GTP-binding protein EngB required for normal cell division
VKTDPATTEKRISRLEEIVTLIRTPLRQITRHRAEKRTLEETLERRKAAVRVALLSDAAYTPLKGDDRQMYYLAALYADPEYQKAATRLDEVLVALDKANTERDELDHERKALKAILEAYAAEINAALDAERKAVDAARLAAQGGHRA